MRAFRLRVPVGQLAAAVVCVVLAGCGGGGQEEMPAEEQPGAAAQPAAEQPAQTPAQQPAGGETEQQPAQESPQPAVVRESETSEHGFYTIQLSAWRTEAKARSEARRYQNLGLEAYVQKAELPGMGTWYRVRVGKYPALSEARRAARALVNIPFEELWMDNYRSGEPPPGDTL